MLNRIVLIGRLTRDPESSYTPAGVAIAKFGLAVDRITKNQETGEREVDFINIVAWRRTADYVSQYCRKGYLVAVEGRLQIRSWVAQDGTRRTAAEVVADNCEILSRPREAEEAGVPAPPTEEEPMREAATAAPVATATHRASAPPPPAEEMDDYDPFADE